MFGIGQQDTHKKKKKHRHRSKDSVTLDEAQADTFGSNPFREESYHGHHSTRRQSERSGWTPEYDQCGSFNVASEQVPGILEQFEAIMAIDREFSQQLQYEVGDLGREVEQMRNESNQLERQIHEELREQKRLVMQMQELESRHTDARQWLVKCHAEKRSMDLNSFALNEDKAHFKEECAFLQQMIADERRALESVNNTNQLLNRSFQHLEEHTSILDQQRREVLREVMDEREAMRLEKRRTAELTHLLDRMKREQLAVITERRESWSREQENRARFVAADLADGYHTWAPAIAHSPRVKMQTPAVMGSQAGNTMGVASGGIWAHMSPYMHV